MELEWYTLDSSLRRDTVIEGFESFLWTERYWDCGDFQIIAKSTYANRTLLTPGTWISRKGSTYVAIVDTVVDQTAEDGTRNLTVTGKMLEWLLNDRVAFSAITDTTTTPNWTITDTPGNICRYIFKLICVDGILNESDTIPFYTTGTLLPAGGIAEESESITVTITPNTVFSVIQQICQTYFLGFRFVKNEDLGQIYFEIYTGSDVTSAQDTLKAVIFDPGLDDLEKPTLLTSTAAEKTVAYVFAQNGSAVVYAVGADISASGTGRRVLLINSSNSDPAGEGLDAALQQEGLLALSSQRLVYAFDGELPKTIPYEYGTDYHLGDLVEERNGDGYGNYMIVTEQIFASDNTGNHAYPTLTIKELVTPGTWSALDDTVHWTDEADTVIWATL